MLRPLRGYLVVFAEQFTGLKDKNDKDIYEGDFVSFDDSFELEFHGGKIEKFIGQVVFDNKMSLFFIKVKDGFHSDVTLGDVEHDNDYTDRKSIKIVGNIFENDLTFVK